MRLLSNANDNRPVILCEYAYQILASGGGFEHFRELTERYPRFQGGFVWDFADKALWQTADDGTKFAGYGGDFFESIVETKLPLFMCLNGIVTHDLRLKPAALDMVKAYAPVFIEKSYDGYVLKNRALTKTLRAPMLTWAACADGDELEGGIVQLEDVPPMSERFFRVNPAPVRGNCGYLNMRVRCAEEEVAREQFPLTVFTPIPRKSKYTPASFDDSHGTVTVRGEDFTLDIQKTTGCAVSLTRGGREYMLTGFTECAVRGLSGLSAQPGWGEFENFAAFTHENCVRRVISMNTCVTSDGRVRFERQTRLTSRTVEGASIDTELSATISGDGRIHTSVRFLLNGIKCVERLGLSFMLPEDFETVEWFGLGPGESYPDRRLACEMGVYKTTVSAMHFPYNPPAENGGREEVRHLSLTTMDGRELTFRSLTPFHFDARHYTIGDLREAAHDHEITRRRQTVLHVDAVHAGIGGDMAWSTVQNEKTTVSPGVYTLDMEISVK